MNDVVTIGGLAAIVDEGTEPPYLALTLACNGREYRAAILAAEGEWAVRVADDRGASCSDAGDLYATQSDAILVAMLIALDDSRQRAEDIPPVRPN